MSSEVKRTPETVGQPLSSVRSSNGRRRASFGAKNCCVCSPTGLEPTIFSAPSHAPINVLHYNCPMTRILCHVQKNARTGLINLTPLSQRSRRLRNGRTTGCWNELPVALFAGHSDDLEHTQSATCLSIFEHSAVAR